MTVCRKPALTGSRALIATLSIGLVPERGDAPLVATPASMQNGSEVFPDIREENLKHRSYQSTARPPIL